MFLRQSTASQEIKLGPFLDDTDGKTAETALTIAATDIKLTKGGSTSEANKNSGGATHVASGRYSAVLDATDTDTVGILEIDVHVAGALPVRRQYYILAAAAYDAIFGTTPTDVAAIKAKTDNLPADPADASDIAAAFSALSAKVDTIDDFLDTEIAAILADTNELQTDWANGGRLDLILDVIELWTKRNAVLLTGTLTGAGTNTEVYTVSALGITATCTTDSSGNRSSVAWS